MALCVWHLTVRLLLISLGGFLNRRQQDVIDPPTVRQNAGLLLSSAGLKAEKSFRGIYRARPYIFPPALLRQPEPLATIGSFHELSQVFSRIGKKFQ
jgi:hypothetical protein